MNTAPLPRRPPLSPAAPLRFGSRSASDMLPRGRALSAGRTRSDPTILEAPRAILESPGPAAAGQVYFDIPGRAHQDGRLRAPHAHPGSHRGSREPSFDTTEEEGPANPAAAIPPAAAAAAAGPDELDRVRHWTPRLYQLALRHQRTARGYADIYEGLAQRAERWLSRLNTGNQVGGGALTIISTAALFPQTGLVSKVAVLVISFAVLIIASIIGNWGLVAGLQKNIEAQAAFAQIHQSIDYQLSLSRADRADAREYVKMQGDAIAAARKSAPIIPDSARRAYCARVPDNPIWNEPAPPAESSDSPDIVVEPVRHDESWSYE